MKIVKIFLGLIFLFLGSAQAGDLTKVGATSANFLQMEVGARAMAIGGAYVGFADDAMALFWNPAGIGLNQGLRAAYQQTEMYAGIRHQLLAVMYALSSTDQLGLLVNYLDVGKMEETTLLEPEGTGQYFDASNIAIGLTYGRQLTNRVSFGVSFKYIQERIWLENARGFAFDVGTIYNIAENGIRIGMALTNLGPDMSIGDAPHLRFYKEKSEDYPGSPQPESQLVTKNFPLPLSFSLGIAVNLMGPNAIKANDQHRVTLSLSAVDAFDAPFRSNYGFEYSWSSLLALRAGYHHNYDTAGLSMGFGLNIHQFTSLDLSVDYAWVDYGDLGALNVWGLEFRL
jgi:hypothetical protein